MKAFIALLFVLICLNSVFYAHAKRFAVLVATTKTWLHYGHQSTILHAYQTLISNGFPRANIVTMFYDDIANHTRNPEPGIIRNHPEGSNVYENVKKDYTGEQVTAENFMAVLTGNTTIAKGPVIKSTSPRDTLFINIVGLGAYGYLTFPTGSGLPARKLVQTLENLTKEKKFRKVFVNADVPFSAALFDGLLSSKSRVFVSAATNFEEHPHAVYCYPEKKLCYGSLYGVAWTQYSDRLRQLKSGTRQTLYDQFNHVRAETPYTHVNIYGDLSIGQSRLSEFLAYKHEPKFKNDDNNQDNGSTITSNSKLGLATPNQHAFDLNDNVNAPSYSNYYDQLLSTDEKYIVQQNRNFIEDTMRQIFDRLRNNDRYKHVRYETALKNRRLPLSEKHSDAYEMAIREFHERCLNINENPFALKEISKLAHLCENNIDLADLIAAMAETCNEKHRRMLNVY